MGQCHDGLIFLVFLRQDNVISTPAIKGTILPGITRKSIIEVAQSKGFKVIYLSISWI
jgi:branched-subunit amino acid aminotransferase/4-amino-4-deoxychorismate lyase